MTFVDTFLNRITMYRLVLYYLIALLAVATLEGAGIIASSEPPKPRSRENAAAIASGGASS